MRSNILATLSIYKMINLSEHNSMSKYGQKSVVIRICGVFAGAAGTRFPLFAGGGIQEGIRWIRMYG